MKEQAMRVEYLLESELPLAPAGKGKPRLGIGSIIGCLPAIVLGGMQLLIGRESFDLRIAGGSALCAFGVTLLFCRLYDIWKKPDPIDTGNRTLALTPDGIRIDTMLIECLYEWEQVVSVEKTPEHVRIGVEKMKLLIPLAAFTGTPTAEAFMAEIQRHLAPPTPTA